MLANLHRKTRTDSLVYWTIEIPTQSQSAEYIEIDLLRDWHRHLIVRPKLIVCLIQLS